MQYILSQEEYDNMVPKKVADNLRDALDAAAGIILKQIPEEESRSIPCIVRGGNLGYCDWCPLSYIGRNPYGLTWDQSNLICTHRKDYGK